MLMKALVVVLLGLAVGWYLANPSDAPSPAAAPVTSPPKEQQASKKAATEEKKTPPAAAKQPEEGKKENAAKKPVEEKVKETTAAAAKEDIVATRKAAFDNFMTAVNDGFKIKTGALNMEFEGTGDYSEMDHETKFANGLGITASDSFEEYSTVLEMPATLQFNDRTASAGFREKLINAAKQGGEELIGVLRHPHMKLYSSILHLLFEVKVADKLEGKDKSKWSWWLNMLPPMPAEGDKANIYHGIFISKKDYECLHVQGKQTVDTFRQQVDLMYNVTLKMCQILSGAMPTKKNSDNEITDEVPAEFNRDSFTCEISKEQVAWGFSVVSSRYFDLEGMATMFPLVDALPYAANAAIRPGVLHKDKSGRHVTLDFIAARDVKKGEPLTFRTVVREAIDQLIQQGFHNDDHFAEGVQLWVQWDQKHAERLDALNCSTSMESTRITGAGTWSDVLHECAQLHVLRAETAQMEETDEIKDLSTEASRKSYNFDIQEVILAGYDFLSSQADLVQKNIPSPAADPQCYDTQSLSPFGRQIALHNHKLRSLFSSFKDRLKHARDSKSEIFQQMNAAEDEVATKGSYEERLASYDSKFKQKLNKEE